VRISFCTTCANRLHQFERTFAANLDVVATQPETEWVILNFGSRDGLDEFITARLSQLPSRVIYARALSNPPWHLSVAKNTAHRVASGDVLFNLDCDNFINNACAVIRHHFADGVQVLHLWSGTFGDGTCGRVAIARDSFYALGGYDEAFDPMAYQDRDLLHRAAAKRFKVRHVRTLNEVAIPNDKVESVRYCANDGRTWNDFVKWNRERSLINIRSGRLTANEGNDWGTVPLEILRGGTMSTQSEPL